MLTRFLVAAALCLQPCAFAQVDDLPGPFAKLGDAPAILPGGCSSSEVADLALTQGSGAYKLLRYQLSAAALGHVASEQMMSAMNVTQSTSLAQSVMKTNLELARAEKNYLCASFLIGQLRTNESTQIETRDLTISVLNRMYLEVTRLKKLMTTLAQQTEQGGSVKQVDFAAGMSAVLSDREDAGQDLELAFQLAYAISIDMTGPEDGGTPYLVLSCDERAHLIDQATSLSQEKFIDEFTRQAHLLQERIKARSCHK